MFCDDFYILIKLKLPTPENKLCPDCFWCGTVFNMIFGSQEECTRKAVIWKLPQISRLARKSLLCNVSMNTCLDDRASRVGSVISVGTLPLRRTTQWCITLQKTQRKHQRVRKCPLKYLNPPLRRVREDTFIEHRNSKAIRLPASR